MDTSAAARQLAAQRKVREKTCPVCGAVFEAFGRREYDTKACANKASYRRVGRKRRARPAPSSADGTREEVRSGE